MVVVDVFEGRARDVDECLGHLREVVDHLDVEAVSYTHLTLPTSDLV